jgi:hypothetical protein
MIDCNEQLYEEEQLQGLKNIGKNYQKMVLTELWKTSTEKPIHPRSVCCQVNVEELRSNLSYNLKMTTIIVTILAQANKAQTFFNQLIVILSLVFALRGDVGAGVLCTISILKYSPKVYSGEGLSCTEGLH